MHQQDNIKFENISLEEGLSQSVVECIMQDHVGFMWFGTQDGLNKYDGRKFTTYRNDPENTGSLCYNHIWSLCEDKNKNLWVGTQDGLSMYDIQKDIFINYKSDPDDEKSISGNQIKKVYRDSSGVVWIGTYGGGLLEYNEVENNFTCYRTNEDHPSGMSGNRIISMLEDRSGNFWIGTWGGGLNFFDRENKKFVHVRHSDSSDVGVNLNRINYIYEDRQDNIYVASNHGLFVREKGKDNFRHFINELNNSESLSDRLISLVMEDRSNNLWVGTRENGLNLFDRETEKFHCYRKDNNNAKSIRNNSINSICEDRSGILWIGTFGSGLEKLTGQSRMIYHYFPETNNANSVCSNLIYCFCEDSDGILWIGSQDNGFNKFDRSNNKFTHYKIARTGTGNNSIMFILDGDDDTIWIGTSGEGLMKFNKKTNEFTNYRNNPDDENSISYDTIFSMVKGKNGIIWIATFGGGLNKFDPATGIFKGYKNDPDDSASISSNRIRYMCRGDENTIWIATDDKGLLRFDIMEERFTRYDIGVNILTTVFNEGDGILWIGTFSSGLIRFDASKNIFKKYTQRDGLPNDTIVGIVGDDRGNIWVSTNKGLSKFKPGEAIFKNYDVRDGFQGNEFNNNAYIKLRSGELGFGGVNGFNIFDPQNIKDNSYIPPVVISNFLIFNKPVEVSKKGSRLDKSVTFEKEITLSYRDSVFSFEFAVLNYVIPGKNQYAYMMEGFDKEWVNAGNRGFATYTNLNHGDYLFRVKGSNNDGLWNEEGTSVKIKITPPFWKTLWFKGFGVLAVAGTAGSIYKNKLDKITKEKNSQEEFTRRLIDVQESDRKRIANDLHDSIGQDLLISKNKLLLSINNKDDKEFILSNIHAVTDIITDTLKDVREISYSLHPYQIERLGLSKAIKSIIDRVSGSTDIEFIKNIDDVNSLLSPVVEISLYRIIQECISNVIKHSHAKEVVLNVNKGSNEITVMISDDGVGFSKEKIKSQSDKYGFGLKGISERVKLFSGKFDIETSPGNGTVYKIHIPVSDKEKI